ncbi:MAG: hypothetical protein AAGG68_07955 [Bacteroidota bacterium]
MIQSITKTLLVVVLIGTFAACDKGKEALNCAIQNFDLATALSTELVALNEAAFKYSDDPSPENCKAYKEAANFYLESATELQDCAKLVGQEDLYNTAIEETEEDLAELDCD